MRISAVCLERLAERRPHGLLVGWGGSWIPVVRVDGPLMPQRDPHQRTVHLPGFFVEDSSFDVRLRVNG